MTYLPAKDASGGQVRVIYRSKDDHTSKTFDALDWLGELVTHIPNKGEQMVRYYGYYRYFSSIRAMPHTQMQEYVNVDWSTAMSIVGLVGRPGQERIIAEGRYLLPIHKWPICPVSALHEKFNPRNINHMPVVKFFVRLDLD